MSAEATVREGPLKVLERRLGLRDVVALSLSTMLGSGIFILPGLAAAKAGPSVWMAYLLAGISVLPAALSKAELATAMPTSGGTYVFLERAWGPLVGSMSGLGLWLSLLLKSSFALVGFAAYLWVIVQLPIVPTALALLVGIVVLNLIGVKIVGRVQQVVMFISVVSLAALAVAGGLSFEPSRLQTLFPNGGGGFLAATGFVFVSYAGVTKIAAIAEEVKQPDRNLPRGMIISLVVAMTIYAFVTLVIVGNVPLDELSTDLRPIHSLAVRSAGPVVGGLAAAVAVVTMTSMANGGLLAASRFPFAMARDRLMPQALARVNPRRLTPVVSILLTGAAMAVAITTLDVEKIAKLASVFKIIIFMLVNITVVVLRESRAQWYQPTYRAPLYPWIQVFGVVSGVVLLLTMGLMAILASVAIALLGTALFFVYGRPRAKRRGVFGLMRPRADMFADLPEADVSTEHTRMSDEAAVAVPLFGHERSPEMLVEVGEALADGRTVEVLHVTEVPEQTVLTAMLDDDGSVAALKRRITSQAAEKGHRVEFNAIVSRDVAKTVHAISARLGCEWLVMEWQARSQKGRMMRNPRGWLYDHLVCNQALFYDAGVRYIREILVYPRPGPHDALVVWTADHMAGLYDGRLTFVRFVPDSGSDLDVQSARDYLHELEAFVEAPTEILIVRGDREIDTLVRLTASYDLLVVGAAPTMTLRQAWLGARADRLVNQASCSVLTLRTPQAQTHEVIEPVTREHAAHLPSVAELLTPHVVAVKVDVARKEGLFVLAGKLLEADLHTSAGVFTEALWQRERTQNTGIGDGVALPHGTLRRMDMSYLGVITTRAPIEYKSLDGTPVDVFFVLFGPPGDRQTHLRLLALVARLVREPLTLDALRSAEDEPAIREVLAAAAQQIEDELA